MSSASAAIAGTDLRLVLARRVPRATPHDDFRPKSRAAPVPRAGEFGGQQYATSVGSGQMWIIPTDLRPTAALCVLGIARLTAYFEMAEIERPRPGDTVLVSGAAGATGSGACQIIRIAGTRVVVGVPGPAET